MFLENERLFDETLDQTVNRIAPFWIGKMGIVKIEKGSFLGGKGILFRIDKKFDDTQRKEYPNYINGYKVFLQKPSILNFNRS